jgi:hypothetical protein
LIQALLLLPDLAFQALDLGVCQLELTLGPVSLRSVTLFQSG